MYYHGIVNGLVDKKVLNILNSREIKSASRLGYSKKIGFNENDYISICSYLGEEVYAKYPNNAFHKYILNNFCFIIDSSITVEQPVFLENAKSMSVFELFNLKRNNPDKRFSDIIDELQVINYIPFEKVISIGIPYNLEPINGFIKLSDFCILTSEEFLNLIKTVEEYAQNLGIEVVDSTNPDLGLMFEGKKSQNNSLWNI